MTKSISLGLTMIMKDEIEDLHRILKNYIRYFDKVYVTVTNKSTFKKLVEDPVVKRYRDIFVFDYFKWNHNFGAARQHNQTMVQTDYWMWMDLDDEIQGAENLKLVTQYMYSNKLDMLLFQYDYFKDQSKKSIQWRERVISKNSGLTWSDDSVHETVATPYGSRYEQISDISIVHRKTAQQIEKSNERNLKILIKDWISSKTPHSAYYLGRMYSDTAPTQAIEFLQFSAENSEDNDRKFESTVILAKTFFLLANYPEALDATDHAIRINPSHPEPWYQKVEIYYALKDYSKAYEFSKVAITKPLQPEHMYAVDPDRYGYKGKFLFAKTALHAGYIDQALDLFNDVRQERTDYVDEQSEHGIDWNKKFNEAETNQKMTREVVALDDQLIQAGLNRSGLYSSLPATIFDEAPIRARRNAVNQARSWPYKSIAYFVGHGYEKWGPESINSGIGGSEESVIYLSRELAKLGWSVTVYCERDDETIDVIEKDISVNYVPWQTLNVTDKFDVFLSSRHPGSVHNIHARKLIAELHDTTEERFLLSVINEIDSFVVRSKWHRTLYSLVPNSKISIIGNGVLSGQFEGTNVVDKRPHSAGYYSNYERGLELLLILWPRIRECVPDATLDICYGWDLFDQMYEGNPSKQLFKNKIISQITQLESQGVREYGRIGHRELIERMQQTSTWLYPTEFKETFCITALKTTLAGMNQVTTNVGALPETTHNAYIIDSSSIYSNQSDQDLFVEYAVKALISQNSPTEPDNHSWHSLAVRWNNLLQ